MLQKNLLVIFRSLISRFLIPAFVPPSDERLVEVDLTDSSKFLPLSAINFGAIFHLELNQLPPTVQRQAVTDVQNRCMRFLLEAAKQIQNRLPANIALWRSITAFSPSRILSQVKLEM